MGKRKSKKKRKPEKIRMLGSKRVPGPGEELVFCKSFRHHVTHQVIVADPGTVFCFVAKRKSNG